MSRMKPPDWFVLIHDWKAKGMGQVGITLPFLVGALTVQKETAATQDIRTLLKEIVENPQAGFVTEVRWCPNVQAPVLSVSSLKDPGKLPLKSYFVAKNGQRSFGFSQDVQSMFGLKSALFPGPPIQQRGSASTAHSRRTKSSSSAVRSVAMVRTRRGFKSEVQEGLSARDGIDLLRAAPSARG